MSIQRVFLLFPLLALSLATHLVGCGTVTVENIPQEPIQEMAEPAKEELIGNEPETQEVSRKKASITGEILARQKFDTDYSVGGSGGAEFHHARYKEGLVVTEIDTWCGGWQLRGMRIRFSNGDFVTIGKEEENRFEDKLILDYVSGERVTALSIWTNKESTRCGGFRIKTNRKKDYWPTMKEDLKNEYVVNVGEGIILGVIGRAGSDIDSLGFLMLDEVKNSVLTEMEYNLTKATLPGRKVAYDTQVMNPGKDDIIQQDIVNEVTVEKHGEWSVTGAATLGQEYTVKGGVPFVAEGEAKTSWSLRAESTYKSSWTETVVESITFRLNAPAGTITRYVYSYFQGKLDGCPFTARLKHYLVNGSIWDCEVEGVYDGVDTTRVVGTSHLIATWDRKEGKWIYK